jgi:D-alanyl-D-alanine dipeptidase
MVGIVDVSRLWVLPIATLVCLIHHPALCSESDPSLQESLDYLASNPDYLDLSAVPGVVVDLKYASSDNFMHENLYGEWRKAYLHRDAAEKLKIAVTLIEKQRLGWKVVVYDALRPRSVQRKLWQRVKGTARQSYVAEPGKGSVHNFGFAVDLSLLDESGNEVDMGTKHDDFSSLSEPRLENKFLKSGELTPSQVNNRAFLRSIMTSAGFAQQMNEWWHYDALSPKEVRAKYPIIE